MDIKVIDNRNCLVYSKKDIIYTGEDYTVVDIYKVALDKGLLSEGKRVFLNIHSSLFAIKDRNLIRFSQMRTMLDGWDDLVFYEIPEWKEVGVKLLADPSVCRYKDTIVVYK